MKYENLPKRSIVTGASALAFNGVIPQVEDAKINISMKRGTNTSTYKKLYKIITQSENTLDVGVEQIANMRIYRIERLYIELDKFDLTNEQYTTAILWLEKNMNIGILRELFVLLKGKIRGIDWTRVEAFAFSSGSDKQKYITKKEMLQSMIKEFIFTTSKIEINTITYIDTEKVVNDLPTNNLTSSEVSKISGLKQAFEYLVSVPGKYNKNFMMDINRYVAGSEIINAGSFRISDVTIGGTTYQPAILSGTDIDSFILRINDITDPKVRAATYIAEAMKLQLFNDGNKRTSLVVGNKILIEAEAGLISIPREHTEYFLKLTKNFYENEYALPELINFLILCMFDSHEEKKENAKLLNGLRDI